MSLVAALCGFFSPLYHRRLRRARTTLFPPQSSLHPEPAPESGFTVRLSCIEYPLFRESVLGAERTRLKATPSQMIPTGRCDENALSIHLIHCRPTRPPQSRDSRFSPAAIKRYHGSPSSLVQETTGLRFGFFFRFCLCFYILSHLIILSTSSLTLCHTYARAHTHKRNGDMRLAGRMQTGSVPLGSRDRKRSAHPPRAHHPPPPLPTWSPWEKCNSREL